MLGIEDLSYRKVAAFYPQVWWCQFPVRMGSLSQEETRRLGKGRVQMAEHCVLPTTRAGRALQVAGLSRMFAAIDFWLLLRNPERSS